MQTQVIQVNDEGRYKSWFGTDRPISISKYASIRETYQALLSRMVLSDDFPHANNYPLAVLTVLVSSLLILMYYLVNYKVLFSKLYIF